MSFLVVVNNPKDWPLELPPGGELVPARSYVTDQSYSRMRGTTVYNLCRSYRYQSLGYYVSLLASARGHRPLPDLSTVHDLRSVAVIRAQAEALDGELQRALKPIKGDEFELSIYFGRNLAKRYEPLSQRLFAQFPMPFMRATMQRIRGRWVIARLRIISANEIPEEHAPFVIDAANRYFSRHGSPHSPRRQQRYRFDLAILHDPNEPQAPSCPKALKYFADAARDLGMRPEFITAEDLPRLPSFDALFIRETTRVDHHTYRFAVRAAAEGLVVIDDPTSILRCTNKVYLKELLERRGVPIPRTMIAHKDNIEEVGDVLGFPLVVKAPDSGFSLGVFKIQDRDELRQKMSELLEDSDLLVAQEYMPTDFDWRVGILDGKPLFSCRYGMARGHWQIMKHEDGGKTKYGWHDSLPVAQAPSRVIRTALSATKAIGDGFYGVDMKMVKGRCYVMEVNDNPNVDQGVEDEILGRDLYERIMQIFLHRIEERKQGHNGHR